MHTQVAIGIIARVNTEQEVLISCRPAHKVFPGYWEFPGGKIQTGETGIVGLFRELKEELGIECLCADSLLQYDYTHDTHFFSLHFWHVTSYLGAPLGLEGQTLNWLPVAALRSINILPGNIKAISFLRHYFNGISEKHIS